MTAPFPCPGCGFLVFGEPPGSYEICPICGWEDDGVQLEAPGSAGGANQDSLYEHQQHVALRLAPASVEEFEGYRRSADWRPVSPDEASSELPEPRIDWKDESIYYWRRSRDAI